MALASLGARTPFITSTPSNAVTFASPAVDVRLGLGAAAGVGSAEVAAVVVAFAASSFAVFASLLPAMAGAAIIASMSTLEHNILGVNMDGLLVQAWCKPWSEYGGEPYINFASNVKTKQVDRDSIARID